ncbi:MAG: hypothetical protein EZS28_010551 [Streblomastix strix]|uniref:Uncharacterized protein n=1 Tax=Streblomastix strix TaxID=222440 RepID=A0A5J4WGW1_9EUKA|nr:MAG: hypothetical protein EZS28_010551 [Streblomastix strix]
MPLAYPLSRMVLVTNIPHGFGRGDVISEVCTQITSQNLVNMFVEGSSRVRKGDTLTGVIIFKKTWMREDIMKEKPTVTVGGRVCQLEPITKYGDIPSLLRFFLSTRYQAPPFPQYNTFIPGESRWSKVGRFWGDGDGSEYQVSEEGIETLSWTPGGGTSNILDKSENVRKGKEIGFENEERTKIIENEEKQLDINEVNDKLKEQEIQMEKINEESIIQDKDVKKEELEEFDILEEQIEEIEDKSPFLSQITVRECIGLIKEGYHLRGGNLCFGSPELALGIVIGRGIGSITLKKMRSIYKDSGKRILMKEMEQQIGAIYKRAEKQLVQQKVQKGIGIIASGFTSLEKMQQQFPSFLDIYREIIISPPPIHKLADLTALEKFVIRQSAFESKELLGTIVCALQNTISLLGSHVLWTHGYIVLVGEDWGLGIEGEKEGLRYLTRDSAIIIAQEISEIFSKNLAVSGHNEVNLHILNIFGVGNAGISTNRSTNSGQIKKEDGYCIIVELSPTNHVSLWNDEVYIWDSYRRMVVHISSYSEVALLQQQLAGGETDTWAGSQQISLSSTGLQIPSVLEQKIDQNKEDYYINNMNEIGDEQYQQSKYKRRNKHQKKKQIFQSELNRRYVEEHLDPELLIQFLKDLPILRNVCPFLFSSRIASPGPLYLYGDGIKDIENEGGSELKEKEKKKKYRNLKRKECFCGEDFGKRLLKLLEGKISIRSFRKDRKKRNYNEIEQKKKNKIGDGQIGVINVNVNSNSNSIQESRVVNEVENKRNYENKEDEISECDGWKYPVAYSSSEWEEDDEELDQEAETKMGNEKTRQKNNINEEDILNRILMISNLPLGVDIEKVRSLIPAQFKSKCLNILIIEEQLGFGLELPYSSPSQLIPNSEQIETGENLSKAYLLFKYEKIARNIYEFYLKSLAPSLKKILLGSIGDGNQGRIGAPIPCGCITSETSSGEEKPYWAEIGRANEIPKQWKKYGFRKKTFNRTDAFIEAMCALGIWPSHAATVLLHKSQTNIMRNGNGNGSRIEEGEVIEQGNNSGMNNNEPEQQGATAMIVLHPGIPIGTGVGNGQTVGETQQRPYYGGLLQLLSYTFMNQVIEMSCSLFGGSDEKPLILNARVLLETLVNAVAHMDYSSLLGQNIFNGRNQNNSRDELQNKMLEMMVPSTPLLEVHIYPTQVIVVNPVHAAVAQQFADKNLLLPLSRSVNPTLTQFFTRCGIMMGAGLGRALRTFTSLHFGMPPTRSLLNQGTIDVPQVRSLKTVISSVGNGGQGIEMLIGGAIALTSQERSINGEGLKWEALSQGLSSSGSGSGNIGLDRINLYPTHWAEVIFPAIAPPGSLTRMGELFNFIRSVGGEKMLKEVHLDRERKDKSRYGELIGIGNGNAFETTGPQIGNQNFSFIPSGFSHADAEALLGIGVNVINGQVRDSYQDRFKKGEFLGIQTISRTNAIQDVQELKNNQRLFTPEVCLPKEDEDELDAFVLARLLPLMLAASRLAAITEVAQFQSSVSLSELGKYLSVHALPGLYAACQLLGHELSPIVFLNGDGTVFGQVRNQLTERVINTGDGVIQLLSEGKVRLSDHVAGYLRGELASLLISEAKLDV